MASANAKHSREIAAFVWPEGEFCESRYDLLAEVAEEIELECWFEAWPDALADDAPETWQEMTEARQVNSLCAFWVAFEEALWAMAVPLVESRLNEMHEVALIFSQHRKPKLF